MDLSDMKPIPNEPALFVENKEILVIADLHIGIESQLREKGLITSSQTQKMTDRLISLIKKYKPRDIVLLGDIKHNIPSASIQERKDVRNFLHTIKEYGTIHIVPGNHDGFINKLSPGEIVIHPSDGFQIENLGFIHGHRWPSEEIMQCEQVIMAHTHPTIMITDRLDHRTFEPCWLKGKFIKKSLKEKFPNSKNPIVLVVPAFNPLCGGIAVNKDGITGPLKNIIDIKNIETYLLDGAFIGCVKDIS
jgi:putative SbcD/Mre11-related phosphoesterase